MCAKEAVAMAGKCCGYFGDGQAGGVGGEHGLGREIRHDAGEEAGFDFEILSDGFDDPVAVARAWAGRFRRCRG